MFFNIDVVEFVVLVALAVILFGPEKLPQFARKAARVFVFLRDIANNAQTKLRDELGPEYADLELKDLNPKSFVKKHMASEIAAIEEAKRDLVQAKSQLTAAGDLAASEVADAKAVARGESELVGVGTAPALRFDLEAT